MRNPSNAASAAAPSAPALISEATETVVKSTCYECDANCPIDVHLDARGEPTSIDGPDCPRCTVQLERRDHPERLLYPLKRVGPRGSGEFERISWDEALDTIAERLAATREAHGAPAVAFFAGYTKEARPAAAAPGPRLRLAELHDRERLLLLGDHGGGAGHHRRQDQDHQHRRLAKTRCVLVWSTNPRGSIPPFHKHPLANKRAGQPLIVVDPRRTPLAEQADVFLQIRPGTDGALALAMHQVIFANGWQDQDFLDRVGERRGRLPRLSGRVPAERGGGHLRRRRRRHRARRGTVRHHGAGADHALADGHGAAQQRLPEPPGGDPALGGHRQPGPRGRQPLLQQQGQP
jgi:anaerobic selenocysteine-containing dehydrogenase